MEAASRLNSEGMAPDEISASLGIEIDRVTQMLDMVARCRGITRLLPKTKLAEILRLNAAGTRTADVARLTGVDYQRVRYHLVKHGRPTVVEDGREAENRRIALAMLDQGAGYADIARAVGIDRNSVKRLLIRAGAGDRIAEKARWSADMRAEAGWLRDQGLKLSEIAAAVGVSQSSVSKMLKATGKVAAIAAPITDGQRAEAVKLHGLGMSYAAVAAAVGVNKCQIVKAVRRSAA